MTLLQSVSSANCAVPRSVGGEFDNEAVAVTAICSTFWLPLAEQQLAPAILGLPLLKSVPL